MSRRTFENVGYEPRHEILTRGLNCVENLKMPVFTRILIVFEDVRRSNVVREVNYMQKNNFAFFCGKFEVYCACTFHFCCVEI